MTEEQIKEQLSRHFVGLVASRAGFKCTIWDPDHGIDVTIAKVASLTTPGGRTRFLQTGQYVDLQLKCACESRLIPSETGFSYDLEAKTYNDLVYRWSNPGAPMLLVILVIPDDDTSWLRVSPEELVLKRAAYWWAPEAGAIPTTNTTSTRIQVEGTNTVDLNFVTRTFEQFYV